MKSELLALLRDEASEDSVENALVASMMGLVFIPAANFLFNARNRVFTAVLIAPTASLKGVIDTILKVGKERNALLHDLRLSLIAGHEDKALELARELCGLKGSHEKSY